MTGQRLPSRGLATTGVPAEQLTAALGESAETAAPMLLGCHVSRRLADGTLLVGRIVEVEAYLGPADQSSHARNGHRSPRNETMYGPAGLAYVYFTYGMHHCLNVVCGPAGLPHAVLVRALEPIEGASHMRRPRTEGARRAVPSTRARASMARAPGAIPDHQLCAGPGRLCRAMAVDRELDGVDLLAEGALTLRPGSAWPVDPADTVRTARIGLGPCGEWAAAPLRWCVATSPSLSRRVRAGAASPSPLPTPPPFGRGR